MATNVESQRGPDRNREFESYSQNILSNAADRSNITRNLLAELIPGVDIDEFLNKTIEEANKIKPGLNIQPPKPGEYLTKAVLDLQYKFLELPREDHRLGCDGKLGPFTLSRLKETLPLLKKYLEEKQKHSTQSREARAGLRGQLPGGRPAGSVEANTYIPDASKQQMIDRGSTPFSVRVGYRLTPEEARWHDEVRRQASQLGRIGIQRRLDYFQERFQLMDALKHSAEMLNIRQQDWNYFLAMNDATLHVESSYNVYAFNRRRSGDSYEVTLSTAAGEYQILNSVWNEMRKYSEDTPRGRSFRAQMRRFNIDPEKLAQIDFSAPRPEFGTPAQRAVVFNFFNFRYSRVMRQLESIDKIYDNIRSTSGRMRSSWIRVMYTYWRNGPNGASPFIRNLRNGIPLPETREEAMDYFNNYLTDRDWQKRRGFDDFWMVMRVTQKYERRFQQNLNELGGN